MIFVLSKPIVGIMYSAPYSSLVSSLGKPLKIENPTGLKFRVTQLDTQCSSAGMLTRLFYLKTSAPWELKNDQVALCSTNSIDSGLTGRGLMIVTIWLLVERRHKIILLVSPIRFDKKLNYNCAGCWATLEEQPDALYH